MKTKDYKKQETPKMKNRSITIRQDQDERIRKERIDFSRLIRDLLDRFFKELDK